LALWILTYLALYGENSAVRNSGICNARISLFSLMNSEIPAMQIKRYERLSSISFYSIPAAITLFSLFPVYSVRFFSNNDGAGHLYI
ncbi:hypothetical protein OFC10_32535, partial [Escherichia coli]|nr:hypothetical protein [Escherichia coli]